MGSIKKKKASPKRRKKNAAKKRGKKSMARKKVVRRKVRRRRNASTTSAKRRAAAKKAAATRKRKKAARSKAAKKAAATRKRRSRRPAKKVVRRKRKNPARKRKAASKRRTVRRKRKNPRGVSPTRKAAVAEAKRMGVKASGTTAAIQRRIAAKHARLRGGSKKKKRKTTKKVSRRKSLRKARRARHVTGKHSRSARAIIRRTKGKSKSARNKRGVARTYMRARSVASRAKKGHLDAQAKKMARVYGLTKVNPSFKSIMKEWKTMLPMGALAGGALLGMTFAGFKLADQFVKRAPAIHAKLPSIVRQAVPAIGAMAATTLAYSLIRRAKGKIAGINISRLAGPIALGGSAAAVLLLAMQTKKGKELMAKAGIVIQAQETAQAGMGSYISVSRYLGDYVDASPAQAFGAAFQSQDISPMGPSWYGRDLGMYEASDFPVHSPGPGDNQNVSAQLGEGIFGGLGAAALPDYELEQTPGGTIVSLSGGIFGGDTAI